MARLVLLKERGSGTYSWICRLILDGHVGEKVPYRLCDDAKAGP